MNTAMFLLLNILLLVACHRFVLRLLSDTVATLQKLLYIAVLYLFSILAISYFLGFVLGKYTIPGIAACVILLFGISFSCRVCLFADVRMVWRDFFGGLRAIFCGMCRREKFAAGLLGFVLLYKLFCTVFLRVYDFDGLVYHLPNLVDYIQAGRFELTEGIVWSNAYPKNFEMFNMWMLVFFRNGSLIKLPQFAVGLLGGMSAYAVLKKIGMTSKNAFVGAMVAFSAPILLAQMNTAYIDAPLCMLLFAGIACLLDTVEHPSVPRLLLFGMAVGIFAGVKYTGVLYAAILLLWLFVALWKRLGFGKAFTKMLVTLPPLAVGCAWYFWNLAVFGNPIFPFGLKIGDVVLFRGMELSGSIMAPNTPESLRGKSDLLQVLLSWLHIGEVQDAFVTKYDARVGGLGLLFILLAVLTVCMVVSAWKHRPQYGRLLALSVVLLLMFFCTPENWWSRYTAFIVLLGGAAVAYFLQTGGGKLRRILPTFVCVLVLFNCANSFVGDSYYLYNAATSMLEAPERSAFYSQLANEYEKWLFDTIGEEPCSIVSFREANGGFNFYGPNTENTYDWYTYEASGNAALDAVNTVETADRFASVIRRKSPDYILITEPFFVYHMDVYTALHGDYTLLAENGGERIYMRK